uniref:Uncharacterized protein n=1 Tax=viral metagenome TaxID=1070528 RepID=A0A6C0H560_9ZZZZ
MSDTLVIILGETRANELTFNNFKQNVMDELNCDLCVCIGVKSGYDYDNDFYKLAKYRFIYNEPDDYGEAFDYAYEYVLGTGEKYECMDNMNNLMGKEKREIYDKNEDYDEIIKYTENYYDETLKNKVYGIKNQNENYLYYEDNVILYKKHLCWREYLKIGNQYLGGIKDKYNEQPGSAGILLFYRWFLLKNIMENGLINKYERFIITRSDFMYQLPHPKLEYLDKKYIWIPDGEYYGGYTDRHAILSKTNVIGYLNILNNMFLKSNEYFTKMKNRNDWNLEKIIKFHLEQNDLLKNVREFPYIMYSVRNKNGSTRWSKGVYDEKLGYYIKYIEEYKKSLYYKNKFENSDLVDIDLFYKSLI